MAKRPDNLDAPWRDQYLQSLSEEPAGARPDASPSASPTGSFLRDYWLAPEQDEKNHVIVRTANDSADLADPEGLGGMILLNLFPYAPGHLLVALGEPRGRLLDYSPKQRRAFWDLVERATALMERTLEPQGVNFGINQGRAAGAGVPQHLHAHLVPRWNGDVNFMTVIAGTRVIPSAVDVTAKRYREMWATMTARGV